MLFQPMSLSIVFRVLVAMFVFNNSEKTTSNKIDVCDLEGYTCIVCTNVVGEFEGADFDKPVKLDNGMIFEFNEYNYTYSYRPEVAVFASTLNYQSKRLTVYKLWIEDEVYDVTRIR